MKTLVVEDDSTSRILLQEILKEYGPVHTAIDGKEAVAAVQDALDGGEPYELICLDIMLPEMDGQEALRKIRALEESRHIVYSDGAKIVMVTALDELRNMYTAYGNLCNAYLVKPIDAARLLAELRKLGLIGEAGDRM